MIKLSKYILFVVISVSLFFTGCAANNGTAIANTPAATNPVVQTTSGATQIALEKVPAEKQTTVVNYTYNIAVALRSLTGTPTPDQVKATIDSFIPASVKAKYPALVISIGEQVAANEYAKYYPQIVASGNYAKAADILNKIATGIENGASAFLK